MNMRRAFDAAISIFSSPSKRQATVPTAAPVDVSRINGVPPDWIGIKCGNRVEPSRRRFPCIGTACAARGIFHEQGSEAQGFRDYSDFGKDTEWQHMCAACASQHSEEQAWRERYDARRRRALDAANQREAERERFENEEIEAAVAAFEAAAGEEQPTTAAARAQPCLKMWRGSPDYLPAQQTAPAPPIPCTLAACPERVDVVS